MKGRATLSSPKGSGEGSSGRVEDAGTRVNGAEAAVIVDSAEGIRADRQDLDDREAPVVSL